MGARRRVVRPQKEDAMNEEDLSRVERIGGRPVIVSRFGLKLMELDGRIYLVAATPDELADAISRDPALRQGRGREEIRQRLLDERSVGRPACYFDGTNCVPYNG